MMNIKNIMDNIEYIILFFLIKIIVKRKKILNLNTINSIPWNYLSGIITNRY